MPWPPRTTASLTDPALRAALAAGLDRPPGPEAAALAAFLAGAFGPTTVAIIHYGSYAQNSGASPESARDFFVIVDRYPEGYRSLAAALHTRFAPAMASRLNRVLPPNVLAVVAPGDARPLPAKVAVLSLGDLLRACSVRARDHFVQGRLFQQVQLAWVRDPAAREAVLGAVLEARARTFEWGRPFLPPRFDAEGFARALLETSYAGEIRPEQEERLEVLLQAQRAVLIPLCGALLEHLAARGLLERDGNRYRDPRPPGRRARLGARAYFTGSKARTTLRWFKYVALYEGWLDYVVRKVERRSGVTLRLSPLERRWPLLFLWPKALRFLIRRPRRRG